MKYDFDAVIDRHATGSVKWDLAEELFGEKDLLPLWIADMDFQSPQPVIDALTARAAHGIYGYAACPPSYYESAIQWIKKRQGWLIDKEWMVLCPGIVPALNMLIQTFSASGDKVIVQQPVYYPFMQAIENNGRQILNSPLLLENNTYRMDFDDLEKKARDPHAKLLVLCSPHNPVGRVWTKEELVALGDICLKHGILIISDEIHADLLFKGYCHVPLAGLSEAFLMQSITCVSPSKTFNLAGLQTANVIIADRKKREAFDGTLARNGLKGPNAFGAAALEAAYLHGEEWLAQAMDYIQENYLFLKKFVEKRIPRINVIEPEATYLVWLDFRELNLSGRALRKVLLKQARVALDDGYIFGAAGEGFERINIACPRTVLEEGLQRIARAVQTI